MGNKFSRKGSLEVKKKSIRGNHFSCFQTKEINSVKVKSETGHVKFESGPSPNTKVSQNNTASRSKYEEKSAAAPLDVEEKIADGIHVKPGTSPSQTTNFLSEHNLAPMSNDEEKSAAAFSDVDENNIDDLPDVTTLGPTTIPVLGAKVKVFIIFHSTYGHVRTLAKKVMQGVDSIEGVEAFLYQVPETLSAEVLTKMGAPLKDDSIPTITAAHLKEADAFLFGVPTRYGMMSAQMKAFFDSTGSLWKTQSLAGKPAGIFVSTGSQGGGQETTALTTITQLTHHGMIYVPIGYSFDHAEMSKLNEPRGGSPYGAGTYTGNGSRMPTKTELAMAEHQGRLTAKVAKLLAKN